MKTAPPEDLQKSLAIYKGLVEVSCLINSITDYHTLLRQILSVAQRVIQAEAASLFLLDEDSTRIAATFDSRSQPVRTGALMNPKSSYQRAKVLSVV